MYLHVALAPALMPARDGLAVRGDRAGYGESPVGEVAVVAEQVVEIERAHQYRRRTMTFANSRAAAFRAVWLEHDSAHEISLRRYQQPSTPVWVQQTI